MAVRMLESHSFFFFFYFWLFSRRRLETSTQFFNLGYKKIEDKFFISSLVLWVQWDYVCKNFFRMEKAFVRIKWLCYVEEHLSNGSVKSVSIAFLIFRTLLEEALIFRTFFRRSACLENTSAFFFPSWEVLSVI